MLQRLVLNLLFVMALATPGQFVQARDFQHVLVIHSYHQGYPWTDGQHQGLVSSLKEADLGSVIFHCEYLDTKRIPYTSEYATFYGDVIRHKYAGIKPAAIFVTDDNALQFAIEELYSRQPEIPVFFSGINNQRHREKLASMGFRGVFEQKEARPNLELIGKLYPGSKEVIFLSDDSPTARSVEQEIRIELLAYRNIKPIFLKKAHLSELLQEVQGLSPFTPVFLTTLGALKQDDDTHLPLDEIIRQLVAHVRNPLFTTEDTYFQPGVIGGYMASAFEQGRVSGELLAKYLAGTAVESLPTNVKSRSEYVFDQIQLNNNSLKLPADIAAQARIVNLQPDIYSRYHTSIVPIGYAVLVFLILALGLGLIKNRRQQKVIQQRLKDTQERAALAERLRDALIKAQTLANIGTWEWFRESHEVFWSDGMFRLLGHDPHTYKPAYETFIDLVHPLDRHLIEQALADCLNKGAAIDLECRINLDHGPTLMVRIRGNAILEDERVIGISGSLMDISDQIRVADEMTLTQRELDVVLSAFPIVLWTVDCDGKFTLSRGAGLALLGLSEEQVVGQNAFVLYKDYPKVVEDIQRSLRGERFKSTTWIGDVAFEVHYSPLYDSHNRLKGAIGVAIDVTERKLSEEKMVYMANYDPVTGLPNRYLFKDRLRHALDNAIRTGLHVVVMFIDLDHFKAVNDTLGHAQGDMLLKQVGERLARAVRTGDTVCRLGGDEFTIILENIKRPAEIENLATRILQLVAEEYELGTDRIRISPSIGIASSPDDGKDVESLLISADTAMYQAKENGRNTYRFASEFWT